MKLKLTVQKNIYVLSVTEDFKHTHSPLLEGGLKKILEAGKMQILLDLTAISQSDALNADLHKELIRITQDARGRVGMDFRIACPFALPIELEAFTTLEQALNTPHDPNLELQRQLQESIAKLTQSKQELLKMTEVVDKNANELREARLKKSDLRFLVSLLEAQLRAQREGYVKPLTLQLHTTGIPNELLILLRKTEILLEKATAPA